MYIDTRNLLIDEELKSLIPPLSSEEYEQLEKNILAEGIREPITICGRTIIDGHNRYSIAKKHNLDFKVSTMEFNSQDEVKEWMILNQFGRRNLSNYDRSILALKLKPLFEEKAKDNLKVAGESYSPKEGSQKSVKVTKQIDTQKELAKVAGVSHDTIAKVQKIEAKAPEKVKEKIKSGEVSINQAYQTVRRIEKIEAVEDKVVPATASTKSIDINNTDKKYSIIYADPAWQYFESGNKNQSSHYKTMTIDDICNIPVSRIADDNCILFLWVTFPILQESFKVIESWGFNYSTCGFNWIKKNKSSDSNFFGCGAWTRANSELCLIATKGSILRLDATISQVVETPIEGHSKKPEIVRELITRLVGKLPRIELFSRNPVDGWDCWGDEI